MNNSLDLGYQGQEVAGRGLDAGAGRPLLESGRQTGFPIDQGAVAVEAQGLEAFELCEGDGGDSGLFAFSTRGAKSTWTTALDSWLANVQCRRGRKEHSLVEGHTEALGRDRLVGVARCGRSLRLHRNERCRQRRSSGFRFGGRTGCLRLTSQDLHAVGWIRRQSRPGDCGCL